MSSSSNLKTYLFNEYLSFNFSSLVLPNPHILHITTLQNIILYLFFLIKKSIFIQNKSIKISSLFSILHYKLIQLHQSWLLLRNSLHHLFTHCHVIAFCFLKLTYFLNQLLPSSASVLLLFPITYQKVNEI